MRFGVTMWIGAAVVLAAGVGTAQAADTKKKSSEGALKIASVKSAKSEAKAVTLPVAAKQPVRRKAKRSTLIARINLTRQRMRVTSNGKVVGNWKISSGKLGHQTPTGRFRPNWTSKMHYSRKYYNSPMPYSVFFNGGIATHGTSAVGRLGAAASHGCIRLRTANARRFYKLVNRHGKNRTRIIVTGKTRFSRRAWRNYKNKRGIYKPYRGASQRTSRSRADNRSRTTNTWGGQSRSARRRHSLREYDRVRRLRHRQRVQRYYETRRRVHPGNIWY